MIEAEVKTGIHQSSPIVSLRGWPHGDKGKRDSSNNGHQKTTINHLREREYTNDSSICHHIERRKANNKMRHTMYVVREIGNS